MDRSQSSSRGVLGPLGLLVVALLWLMTLSGNIPAGSKPTANTDQDKTYIEQKVVPLPDLAHNPATTNPTSLPTTGTGT